MLTIKSCQVLQKSPAILNKNNNMLIYYLENLRFCFGIYFMYRKDFFEHILVIIVVDRHTFLV